MTHSAVLMPLIDTMLSTAAFDKWDIDYIACSAGPGSFTGLRIGAAAAKGLAFALSRRIVRVSTLDAMAYNVFNGTGGAGIVVPIMDARRNQVYAALYEACGDVPRRLTEDLACDFEHIARLATEVANGLPITFLGDGCAVHRDKIATMQNAHIMPIEHCLQRAVAVGALALQTASHAAMDAADFEPTYVRPSQAEREASKS